MHAAVRSAVAVLVAQGDQAGRRAAEDIRGGDSLRGVTISSAQLVPAALAVFGALHISIDDGET